MNKFVLTIFLTILLIVLQSTAQEIKNVTENANSKINTNSSGTNKIEISTIQNVTNTTKSNIATEVPTITTYTIAPAPEDLNTSDTPTTTSAEFSSTKEIEISTTPTEMAPLEPYCTPSLCELFNGTHIHQVPHIACKNRGNFGTVCGSQPHLLYMSERRRNLILDLHNLARSRIASGQVAGYKSASHMPQLKWDSELEYLASLHAKRCKFAHDLCRNTPRFEFSGQNIGYFWIRRDIKSHSRRMKNFIVNWFKEHVDANQTYIDSYYPHADNKKIGHFTLLVADRVHRVGCAAIRFREPDQLEVTKFLMTCNYDFTNILGEAIYQTGPTASKCSYKISEKYPALCDWKDAVYDYDSEESSEDSNLLDNNIETV